MRKQVTSLSSLGGDNNIVNVESNPGAVNVTVTGFNSTDIVNFNLQ